MQDFSAWDPLLTTPLSILSGGIDRPDQHAVRPPRPNRYAARVTRLGLDRRFIAWSALGTLAALAALGLATAILPNPVFGRQIPPDASALAVWLLSAPLMGLIAATYLAPVPGGNATPLGPPEPATRRVVYAGTIGAFLAIGCPVCNKVALVLLGTSGALNVWAPLQPVLGAASLVLLGSTLAWRFRGRSRGAACASPDALAA